MIRAQNIFMPVDINSIVLMLFFKLCITGNLQSTETIYKYYIQVQDEEDNDATPVTPTKSSPGATPTKQSPSPTK